MRDDLAKRLILLSAILTTLFLTGCQIEETTPPQMGSVRVTLSDNPDSTDTIKCAAILIDGRETPRKTPATLSGLSVGSHRVSTFKPGYVDTAAIVEIAADQTIQLDLITVATLNGAIDLTGAPDGTVLLLNNIPAGAVPSSADPPTLFQGLGIGTFRVSAYLPGHATEFPAPWTVALSSSSPFALSPIFTPTSEGIAAGDLAPIVSDTLWSDWENTPYSLQDYRGQVVLLTFFFYNCTACIEEFPHIQSVYEDSRYQGKLQVLGADFVDPFETFARFREDHSTLGLTFPLVHNRTQSLRDPYAVTTHPANYLIDQTGRVRMARGGITEPELRQQIDALIGNGQAGTFRFEMRETNMVYTDGDQTFEFHGTVANLLSAPRSFVFTLDPVIYPDTNRQSSICVGDICTMPRSGEITYMAQFEPMHVDSGVRFSVYNYVTDPETGFPVPSPVSGDHTLDVFVYPADNASEIVSYRLLLDDISGSSLVRSSRRAWSR